MDRSAPAGGYEFGTKRHYRRNVWRTFREFCVGRRDRAQALLMPSAEGTEIDVALANGFREWNLHVVDKNPAIVAHLKRRYPKVNTYGVTAAKAAIRIVNAGVTLDVANLDLCNKLSEGLIDEVAAFMSADVMRPGGGLVAANMLRGRERGQAGDAIEDAHRHPDVFKNTDAVRLAVLKLLGFTKAEGAGISAGAAPWISGLIKTGVYKSTAGNQTMRWSIFRVRRSDISADVTPSDAALWQRTRAEFQKQCAEFGPSAAMLQDVEFMQHIREEPGMSKLIDVVGDWAHKNGPVALGV